MKRFGPFTALKTMDLTIDDGEFVVLLGPSGCGKSTTMNMIAGMETPGVGRILFGDRDMGGVAIGRSAVMEPAIFLQDEPLSIVDAAFRAVMRTELKQLQRSFRQTMVYVTHDQSEAMTMVDRIAMMDHGVLQQVGTPLQVRCDGCGGVADLGIRPDDLRVTDWTGGDGLPAQVTEAEPLGGYTVVTLTAGPQPLRARLRGQPDIKLGAQVALGCDPARVIYFSGDGKALPRTATGDRT